MSFKVDATNASKSAETFLTSFPVQPKDMENLEFNLYAPIIENPKKKQRILVAEAGKMEYVGDSNDNLYNCKYAIGIVDKSAKTVKLYQATALSMKTIVKTLKNITEDKMTTKNALSRNQLGQTFGSRKKKLAIKAQEQNVINMDGLMGVADVIKDTIQDNAPVVPLKEELLQITMSDRLIPPCDLNAGTPDKVYNIDDIIPPNVFAVIDIKPFWKCRTIAECSDILNSLEVGTFVRSKIEACLMDHTNQDQLKKLIYLSYMCRLYTMKHKDLNNEHMAKRLLCNASPLIADTLRQMFLDTKGEGEDLKYVFGAKSKDKLLAYILCLSLMVNSYTLPITQLASDFKLTPTFLVRSVKELGARVEGGKKGEDRVGFEKRALLAIPLVFPKKSNGKSQ